MRPQADIEGCRVAHDLLRSVVADLGDAEVRRASKLPGWSVGHVLTHLARNAEAMCRRIDAAVRSEVIDQYEGGRAGRAAEIEAGANRDAAALRNDATSWSLTLDDLFQSLPDEVWARPVRTVAGDEHQSRCSRSGDGGRSKCTSSTSGSRFGPRTGLTAW